MGSWNKTCGLTGLHIISGTPVYVVPLRRTSYHDRCYTTAFWSPGLVPFESVYNDYGGGEQSQGPGLDLLIETLKRITKPMELGDNQYHDIAINPDDMSEELFFEAVHEGRLFTKDDHEIDFVMLRKDVTDDMLDSYKVEYYVGDGKGTTGWGKAYAVYGFQDTLNDVPEFISTVQQALTASATPMTLGFMGIRSVFDHKHPNRAAAAIRMLDSHRYGGIYQAEQEIIDLLRDNQVDAATELAKALLKGIYIDGFYDSVRKSWMPGSHEGSQADESAGYLTMADILNRALARERAEWLEENMEEDEEEDEEEV